MDLGYQAPYMCLFFGLHSNSLMQCYLDLINSAIAPSLHSTNMLFVFH
jgi:hypothetical protein